MTVVRTSVEVRIEVDQTGDPATLERRIAEDGRRVARELYPGVARELYQEAVSVIEQQAVAASGGIRQRREARWVTRLFGRVRLSRYRLKDRGVSFHPLDRALGLRRGEPWVAVRQLVAELAPRFSYREIARVLTLLTGEGVSHQQVSRLAADHSPTPGRPGDP